MPRCLNCGNKFEPTRFLQKHCGKSSACIKAEGDYQREKRNEQNTKKKPSNPLKRTPMPKPTKAIPKVSDKRQKERKEERKEYPVFFLRMIEKITREKICCENCGEPIRRPDASNVAHILSKRKTHHPEIAIDEMNVVFLCGIYSDSQCHYYFDSSLSARREMTAFSIAAERISPILYKLTNHTKERAQIEDYLNNK